MGGAHGATGRAEQQAFQQCRRCRPGATCADPGALPEDRLCLVPEGLVDDRRVLAGVDYALVQGEADVHPVAQNPVEVPLSMMRPRWLRTSSARSCRASTVADPTLRKRWKIMRI